MFCAWGHPIQHRWVWEEGQNIICSTWILFLDGQGQVEDNVLPVAMFAVIPLRHMAAHLITQMVH